MPAKKYILSLILLMCLKQASPAEGIYLSPGGSDTAAGTIKAPMKSLKAALISARKHAHPITIWLEGGVYSIKETIQLSSQDAESRETALTIRAMPGKTVILRGGESIPAKLFRRVSAPAQLARLHEKARGQVFAADLAGTDLSSFFTAPPVKYKRRPYAMLTWQGYTLQQARWPNRGYAWFDKVPDMGPTTRWGWDPVPYSYDRPIGGRFTARKDGLLPAECKLDFTALKREFDRSRDMTVVGYLSCDWRRRFDPVGRIHDTEEAVQLLGPTDYGIDFKQRPLTRRFFLLNVLCQLDEPGEWYFDYQEKRLYVWPVKPPADTSNIAIAGGPTLIKGDAAQYVTLRDLVFENFGANGVAFQNSHHILVAGCTFRSGNGRGLYLTGGTHNSINGCDFYGLHSAFALNGRIENRRTLTPEHNVAVNNHIHHCRLRGYGLLSIGGVAPRFAHNLLHSQNGGMFYGDNDAVIEYNEFYDMGFEMGDWNVAYNGADLTKANNRFRWNFVHHLMETPKGYPVAAARADDGGAGLRAMGNFLYKCGRSGFEFHGPANAIENNVVLETKHLWWTVQKPDQTLSKTRYLAKKRKEDRRIRGTYIKEDVIGKAERLLGPRFWERDTVWTRRYPFLKEIFDLDDHDHCPWTQAYCRIQRNYIWPEKPFPFHFHGKPPITTLAAARACLPATSHFESTVAMDPHAAFVDPDRLDFRFRKDFKPMPGFRKMAFEKIGLYRDKYRREMPDKRQYRLDVLAKYKGIPSHGGLNDLTVINQRYPAPEYLKLYKDK